LIADRYVVLSRGEVVKAGKGADMDAGGVRASHTQSWVYSTGADSNGHRALLLGSCRPEPAVASCAQYRTVDSG
jgi:hypothetical protein